MLLYQDAHLLLVEKPVGLLSQEDAKGGDSLPARLAMRGLPVKPVHRLDRHTGGVMVYARTGKAAAALSALVGQHDRFLKEYLAVIHGCPTAKSGEMEDLLYHDAQRNKSYPVKRERKGVRLARLSYEVLASTEELSLVMIRLHTGRTHQIRVQFASRGMPLWGDRLYGGGDGVPALWSYRLTFPHPFADETVTAESHPPTDTFPWCLFAKCEKNPDLKKNVRTL